MLRPKLYFIIVIFGILQIISGIFEITRSLPVFTLIQNIKDGGMRFETDKVYIEKVMPFTPAAEVRLTTGDIIVSANNIKINTTDEFTEAVHKNRGKSIDITVNRNGDYYRVSLIPRIDSPSDEGPTGVIISNSKFEKVPVFSLIVQTLIHNISWKEFPVRHNEIIGPIGIFRLLQPKEYFRPINFIMGIFLIIISAGLLALTKWSLYGMFILTIIGNLQSAIELTRISFFSNDFPLIIIFSVLSILLVYFLYTQRRFFK